MLVGTASGRPVKVSVVLHTLFIAHSSFCSLAVCLLKLLLPVDHAASPGTVHALARIHVQFLQMLGQVCPGSAAGHALIREWLGANLQGSHEKVGDGLPCCSVLVHSQVEMHRASQVKVMVQWPVVLFLVVSGRRCSTAPIGSLFGTR